MTQYNHEAFSFSNCRRRQVKESFFGEPISSNGGSLLVREVDPRMGLTMAVARALGDQRQRGKVRHDVETMVRQRVGEHLAFTPMPTNLAVLVRRRTCSPKVQGSRASGGSIQEGSRASGLVSVPTLRAVRRCRPGYLFAAKQECRRRERRLPARLTGEASLGRWCRLLPVVALAFPCATPGRTSARGQAPGWQTVCGRRFALGRPRSLFATSARRCSSSPKLFCSLLAFQLGGCTIEREVPQQVRPHSSIGQKALIELASA